MPRPHPLMVLLLIAFALGTSVARAQLPNLRRKAKEAARQAVPGQQPRRPPSTFDNRMI